MKYYRVRKLDRRYTGGDVYRYRVEIDDHIKNPDKAVFYRAVMEWCRTTWGGSSEVRHDQLFRHHGLERNPHWCYDNEYYHDYYIYLQDTEELTMFELRWPVDR